ncbi:hypothetical protein ElyMa_006776900 [Elysia marginata]|uniref:Uncharacterized protein n=1 Tax=Elysia marginata TaxID=1093978 RepID=A0AAV4J4W8_9GAST|nr:hypothetical protein ElyMa_006776900 [Elysia marginata]
MKDKSSENKRNTKEQFRIVNGLLKHSKVKDQLPFTDNTQELTETFSKYFEIKITKLRIILDETRTAQETVSATPMENGLDSLNPATKEEVKNQSSTQRDLLS